MFSTYLARTIKNANNSSDSSDDLFLPDDEPDQSPQAQSSPTSRNEGEPTSSNINASALSSGMASIPQILIVLNMAFSLTGNSKKKRNTTCNPTKEAEVATDARVKHCKTNGQPNSVDGTVPTTITMTTTSCHSSTTPSKITMRDFLEEDAATFHSYEDETEREVDTSIPNVDPPVSPGPVSSSNQSSKNSVRNNNNYNQIVKSKIQKLRHDLQNLQPKGVAGNALFWWIHPVKWACDPVLGVAEAVVPTVTSTVPFSDKVIGVGLDATTAVAHGMYGATKCMGIMSSQTEQQHDEEGKRLRLVTQLLSLRDLSQDMKERLYQTICSRAGRTKFLLGIKDTDQYFGLTLEQNAGIEIWANGFGGLYDHTKADSVGKRLQKVGGIMRYYENKAVLGVLQRAGLDVQSKLRHETMLVEDDHLRLQQQKEILAMFPIQDACRYIKFAIAAYGDNGITSVDLELHQSIDLRAGDLTRTRIAEYTGVPCEDIEVLGVDYASEPNHLSHFVAVDHFHRKIVLAIRGTHPLSSSTDNDTKDFLEGRAHKGIAIITENLWKSVGYPVIRLLHENPWYELIVTGHSLGAGATVLLNLLLHKDERIRGHNFRCYAFGSPPVYEPLSSVPNHVAATCVTFINQFDKVPFSSKRSIQQQNAMIDAVEHMDVDLVQRAKLVLGLDTPNIDLVQQMQNMERESTTAMTSELRLGCPCAGVLWMVESNNNGTNTAGSVYGVNLADPIKIASGGLLVHKNDFQDHLPARYEQVLSQVEQKNSARGP